MQLSCFIPCSDAQLARLPKRLSEYLDWQEAESELNPFLGRYHWVLQTQLQLQLAGIDARLTNRTDGNGILYSHVECLPYDLKPTRNQLLMAALVDKEVILPHAFLHITHNPLQKLPLFSASCYMPPWPQIGLIPRATGRGNRFENLVFMGNQEHLHPFFSSQIFRGEIERMGIKLVIPKPKDWNDFSSCDCIIALRNFGDSTPHKNRPALKLFNAWRAGVPAILGFESAYRHIGCAGSDYLEALSEQEVLEKIRLLASNAQLRRQLIASGLIRATEVTDQAIRERWKTLLEKTVYPYYERWRSSRLTRSKAFTVGAAKERLLWRIPTRFL
jgi:hypothetical protein